MIVSIETGVMFFSGTPSPDGLPAQIVRVRDGDVVLTALDMSQGCECVKRAMQRLRHALGEKLTKPGGLGLQYRSLLQSIDYTAYNDPTAHIDGECVLMFFVSFDEEDSSTTCGFFIAVERNGGKTVDCYFADAEFLMTGAPRTHPKIHSAAPEDMLDLIVRHHMALDEIAQYAAPSALRDHARAQWLAHELG